MNIIADYHHEDLFKSLLYLFQKRLGWTVYRPFGMDWVDKGYYNIYGDNVEGKTFIEGTLKNNIIPKSWNSELKIESITLEESLTKDIDIVIGSTIHSERAFKKFIRECKPKSKFIRQIGNQNESVGEDCGPNFLVSDLQSFNKIPSCYNKVLYHQEFSLDEFSYGVPKVFNIIRSFMNISKMNYYYKDIWDAHLALLKNDYNIYIHGLGGPDGTLHGSKEVAEKMQDSTFVWHVKRYDGYGHIIHNAYACGRPIITRYDSYKDKLGGLLLEENKTCIMLGDSVDENIGKIKEFSIMGNYNKMSGEAYKRFKEVVNFDDEEIKIRSFLEKI